MYKCIFIFAVYSILLWYYSKWIGYKLGYKEDQDIQHLYIQELIYQTRLTNNELIDLMKTVVEDKSIMIKADCAEPDRIMEIARAGFCITACKKGVNSVIEGIDRLKRFHIHITKSSVNTIKEIKGWKFQRDKKTEEVLDKPVEYKDDAMAASRYGSEGIGTKGFMEKVRNGFERKRTPLITKASLNW